MSYQKENEEIFSSLCQLAEGNGSLQELVFRASQYLIEHLNLSFFRVQFNSEESLQFHFSTLPTLDPQEVPTISFSEQGVLFGSEPLVQPFFSNFDIDQPVSGELRKTAPKTPFLFALPIWLGRSASGVLLGGRSDTSIDWEDDERIRIQQVGALLSKKLLQHSGNIAQSEASSIPKLLSDLQVSAISVFPLENRCVLTAEAADQIGLRHLLGKSFSIERLVSGIAESDRAAVEELLRTGKKKQRLRFSFAWDDELHSVLASIEPFDNSLTVVRLQSSENQERTEPTPQVIDRDLSRILTHGKLVIIRTDPSFRILDFVGEAKALLGISRNELLREGGGWSEFLDPRDFRRLMLRLRRMENDPHEFSEEIRILERGGEGDVRWFLLRSVPRIDSSGKLVGWEGLAVDITERRLAEDQLRTQRERIETLYQVSRSLQVKLDPALVMLKGLKALVRTLRCDGGIGCFYDAEADLIDIVAAEGLSQRYVEKLTEVIDQKSLVRHAVSSKRGILVQNIQEDPRANHELARIDDLRSTIVMPVLFEDRVLGALVLFSKNSDRFTADDRQLVSAAASQIGLAARQAEFYSQEREQADSLAVLYQLNHEFSSLFTTHEIAQHTLSVLQEHFACRRGWFGVLSPTGTHIVGQGGFGPGVRTQLQKVQVELGLRHDFFDEAIRTKQPIVVPNGTEMECSGLNRLMSRLRPGTFLILPLVALGEVLGVVVMEPVVSSSDYLRRKLPLLTNMSMEIAACLASRRLEQRVAEADKMRMATVLGAGVAHNFNNLLQAVMGQASLIEMQLEPGSSLHESAHTIVEAASRGAGLVKHLLSFSSGGPVEKERLDIGKLLVESKDLYGSMLGGNISLKIDSHLEALEIEVDYGQFQQMLSNILVNAREAIDEDSDGLVTVQATPVRLRSSEIDPELSPGSYVRIDIEDNGRGMDDEELERCFEPFYSRKARDASTGLSLTGSGLGLSSAYSWAKQEGGILTVSSTKGEGAIVRMFLPRLESGEVEHQESFSRTRPVAANAALVGFEDSVNSSLQGFLESLGLASDKDSKLEAIEERLQVDRGSISVLFVDLDHVPKEAVQLLLKLEKRYPEIPMIALSVSRERWFEKVRSATRLRLLEKPLRLRSIQAELRQLLPEFPKPELSNRVEVITAPSREKTESNRKLFPGQNDRQEQSLETEPSHDRKRTASGES